MKKNVIGGTKRVARPPQANLPSQLPTDFIALGTKQKDNNANQYRMPPSKKPKIHATTSHHLVTPLSRLQSPAESSANRMSPTIPDPTVSCIDCPPEDIVYRVLKHLETNPDQAEGIICGAIRNLRLSRIKPDATTVLSLLHLAKIQPAIFTRENIVESLCSLLKKDLGVDYIKSKTNNIIAIIACSILMKVLEKEENWPTLIVQVFLDDSFAERIWVDHIDCQYFVKNIQTAFGTKLSQSVDKDDEMTNDLVSKEILLSRFESSLHMVQSLTLDLIKDRLSRRQSDIGGNSLSVGQGQTPTGAALTGKYLIRTLTSACGMQEVRSVAVQKLEMWLQNPKLVKPAQDLLHAICVNCGTHSQEDVDVIGCITKLRLKSKLHTNQYLLSIKELVDAHPDNLKTMFSYVLYNELSNARNPSNMAVVVSTLQNYPEAASKTLASVCQDLLLQQEDYLRAVRSLLREIIKHVKHEIRFTSLALGLMQEPDMEKYIQLDQAHKDRFISSTCDLICLTMLLSITPQAKEAIHVISGKKKAADSFVANPEAVNVKFKQVLAEIQHDSLWWLHVIVIPQLNPTIQASEYLQLFHKVLFLKSADSYHTRDNWPPESERGFMVKACHDVSVLEDALLRVAAIGLSQEHPLSSADALELLGQLIRRAGSIARPDLNPLTAERVDFIDTILALCQYHHPGTIQLPAEYIPPSLAISMLYWTALQSLLAIISFNPSTIGHQAWTQYPMLKVLMEMCIVNRFTYPPVTLVDEDVRNQIVGKELQMGLVEKSEILEFESHLAAATTRLVVTEESSLLLSQLMAMDPQGHPRRPPERFLEQISSLSSRLQLGVWLCRSRQPDFLLEIINRHGENQSMSWLPDLVASTKGDVGLLPVQCVCEFLLVHDSESEKLSSGGIHTGELVSQLRSFLLGESLEEPLQVSQYFLKRLYSPQKVMRERARKALTLVLSNVSEDDMEEDHIQEIPTSFKWLLCDFVQTPHYASVIRPHAVEAIRSAALIEAEPLCVIAYIKFLANDLRQFQALNSEEESFEKSTSYARMVARLLLNRRIVVDCAISMVNAKLVEGDQASAAESFIVSLLEIFLVHIRQAQEHDRRRRTNNPNEDGMPWSDSQDEIYVEWPNNVGAATLHIFIPQASIILLGFGPPSLLPVTGSEVVTIEVDGLYNELMGLWFSEEGYVIPQAFLMDTQEEALLIPDWLRLKMLRSEVTPITRRLAFAAVRDLEVDQIVLFVQSFGIPVKTMNLLLEILDSQCDSNSEVILNATRGNASYMSTLLDVQRMRGCKAGLRVSELLKTNTDDPTKKVSPSCVIDLLDDSSDSSMDVDSAIPYISAVPQDLSQMRTLLLQLFSSSGSKSNGWSPLLQSINQVQNPINTTARFCLEALYKVVVVSEGAVGFISSLYHSPSRSCCLFRALDRALCSPRTNTSSECLRKFDKIMAKLEKLGKTMVEKLGSKAKSLYTLITSWQARRASGKKGSQPRRMSSTSEQSDNLRQSDWSRLEEFLRHQLVFMDKDEEIKAKVGLVAQILLEEISHRRTQMSLGKIHYTKSCFTSIGTTGLLVDWLQLLDPELLAHTPTLQRKLLFESGRNDFSDFSTPVFDQAYLLSLLAEHCNWETIHKSLDWLLSDATPDPTNETFTSQSSIAVDPKSALDFVWVVIQAPKIWKGRENKSTSVSEPVLELSCSQFSRLLTYIVATTANQKVSDIDDQTAGHGTNYIDLFSIYFRKFHQAKMGRKHVCDIAHFLRRKIKLSSQFSPYTVYWWQLLAQLYVIQPNIPAWDELVKPSEVDLGFGHSDLEKFSDTVTSIAVGSDCYTDALVCSLLNRLGYVRSRSTVETRVGSGIFLSSLDSAYDANLILTKMASSRPLLILRQLPLLSAMLRGRTRHDFFEFKLQHHLPLMVNTIGIVQQLAPHVYREAHSSYLFDIMEMLWQMIRNYCHRARRQMLPVLLKTLNLTHDYVNHSPADAIKILTKHQITFQMLCRTYSDQENIASIVTGLQSSVLSWSNYPDGGLGATFVRPPVFPHSMSVGSTVEKALPICLELIGKNQDLENILQVLADFDESSKRRIDHIAPYIPDLRRIFSQSRDPKARVLALSAALRHARNHPESADAEIFPEYFNGLKEINGTSGRGVDEVTSRRELYRSLMPSSSSPDSISRSLLFDTSTIARDLLQFLPDMVILCRENAPQLLGTAFDAGTKCDAALACHKPSDGAVNRNESADVTNVLARSLWLVCGLDESDMKPKS